MLTIYPHIYKKLSYDPATDLSPVSIACVFDFGFAVGPAVPESVKNINDFMAWAKANPAQANFGSPAAGSTPHFVGALLGRHAGVEIKHVAYRGTQPAMLDLLGGQIAAVSGPIGDITQHLPTGKVRILATSGAKRNRFAPNVPTYAEQGRKEFEEVSQALAAKIQEVAARAGSSCAHPGGRCQRRRDRVRLRGQ
jgi:tripartite-type tricarboxylate transporter receptor subunit TctC